MHVKKEIGDTKDVLQDVVVVVSLVTTLAKSFGSAGELYRKLKEKTKNTKKGLKEDIKQEIEEHLSDHEHNNPEDRVSKHDKPYRNRRRRDESCDSGKESIEHSYELVRSEYDRGYNILGEKYAIGDLVTRNRLQAQVIILQQRALYTYEDIILNPNFSRHPPSYHLRELVYTARAARSAIIDALAQQYQRMLPGSNYRDPLPYHSGPLFASPTVYQPRENLLPGRFIEHTDAHQPAIQGSGGGTETVSENLFCLYSRNLQRNLSLPLTDTFRPGGNGCCPCCQAHILSRPNKAWEIVKEDEQHQGHNKVYLVGTRFLVKCHRKGGGYACVLCTKYKDADTVCAETRALVDHLWKEHDCAELESDENIGLRP